MFIVFLTTTKRSLKVTNCENVLQVSLFQSDVIASPPVISLMGFATAGREQVISVSVLLFLTEMYVPCSYDFLIVFALRMLDDVGHHNLPTHSRAIHAIFHKVRPPSKYYVRW